MTALRLPAEPPHELIFGAGLHPLRRLSLSAGVSHFVNPYTVDNSPDTNPHLLHDLNIHPIPLPSSTFTEIHAYDVLEHLGTQGDHHFFFSEFREYHRLLVPYGLMYITVPLPHSPWAFGDPSHRRVLPLHAFFFLTEQFYRTNNADQTQASPFESLVAPNWWHIVHHQTIQDHTQAIILQRLPVPSAHTSHRTPHTSGRPQTS